MSRSGFDQRIHPCQLQLRFSSVLDAGGIQNTESTTFDFREGKVTNYHTADNQISTMIREYFASDDELKELYSFFTMENIEKFESMSENEKEPFQTGYFDCATLRYLLIGEDGWVVDGTRGYIYSNDPIVKALRWMYKTSPFDSE